MHAVTSARHPEIDIGHMQDLEADCRSAAPVGRARDSGPPQRSWRRVAAAGRVGIDSISTGECPSRDNCSVSAVRVVAGRGAISEELSTGGSGPMWCCCGSEYLEVVQPQHSSGRGAVTTVQDGGPLATAGRA